MPHLHTNPGEHDHTACVYLFRIGGSEPKILLHRHRKLGTYMQFGGHIELTEHPMQTVAHELSEESGYTPEQVSILQPSSYPDHLSDSTIHPQPAFYSTYQIGSMEHFHTDIAFAAATNDSPHRFPDDGESTDIQLFTRQQIINMPGEDIFENTREIVLYMFDNCLPNWQPVPLEKYL